VCDPRTDVYNPNVVRASKGTLFSLPVADAESRAALERDPASDFLADQLARAMTKKVAILRTVASLPARS
jgi:tRNA G18 (ribose-2'-O)-methylase SpoU